MKLEQIASLIAFHYLDHKDILPWQVHLVVFLHCILFWSTILKGKNEFYAKFYYSACFVWGFFLFWTILSDIQIIALNYISFFIRTFGT